MSFYPDINDPSFLNKITRKIEFTEDFDKKPYAYQESYQNFLRKFINPNTPYNSLLLMHTMGTGKTCSAISIAEGFKGKMKIIFFVKNNIIKDTIIDEIKSGCTNDEYFNDKYRKDLLDPAISGETKEKINKRALFEINKYYEFYTYEKFVNQTLGQKVFEKDELGNNTKKQAKDSNGELIREIKGRKITELSNSVVIIDEIQNITNNENQDAIYKVLQNSTNIRLILLSGTPMMDNVEEMIQISNLLNFRDPYFTQNKEGVIEQKESSLLKNTILKKVVLPVFTKEGEALLAESMIGKISNVAVSPLNFPRKIEKGEKLTGKLNINVIKCEMSKYQYNIYKYIESKVKEDTFHKNTSDSSTLVFPAKDERQIENNPIDSDEIQTLHGIKYLPKDLSFLHEDILQRYSTKLYSILQNIKQAKGPIFIYSSFVLSGGTKLISKMLDMNGFTEFGKKKENNHNNYVLFGTELSDSKRRIIKDIFNSMENKDGSLIRILIGSPVVSEGVTFKRIRQVHVLEPSWNLSRIYQVIGRAVRNHSHDGLSRKDQEVEIFKYVATSPNKEMLIDELKYIMSEEKDRQIKKVERLLKTVSIDCFINKKRIEDMKRNSEYKNYYKDGERDCDYMECDYECSYKESVDKDEPLTYSNKVSPSEIKFIKREISKLFSVANVWDLDKIVNKLKDNKLNEFNIYYALQEMIDTKQELLDHNSNFGYIIYTKGYYVFKPTTIIKKKEPNRKTIDQYLTSIGSVVKKPIEKNIPIPSTSSQPLPITQVIIEIDKSHKLYGLIDNNMFKLVDKRKVEENERNIRKIPRGKECASFSKKELDDIIKLFDIKVVGNKTVTCKAIEEYMSKRNMIERK